MDNEQIKQLEEKLSAKGRSVRCIDHRIRPGHPADYVCRFRNGSELRGSAYSYEAALSWGLLLKESGQEMPIRPRLRQTRTFALLPVSQATFDEVKKYLLDVEYNHAIMEDGGEVVIDMHGIALVVDKEVPPNDSAWHKCEYQVGAGMIMETPIGGYPLTIRCKLSGKVEYFLGYYEGSGQFKIETKAELLDDGSHRKLYSRMGAHVVTHWSYCLLPE